MKKIIANLAILTMVSFANADVTNYFPNGRFDSPAGAKGAWTEVGPVTFSYPMTGGNPDGYGVMDATVGDPWGIWVAGQVDAVPIAPLGLVAGGTYTFVQDMKTIATSGAGGFFGGVKIESWGPSGILGNSGDQRVLSESSSWVTYAVTSYTLEPGTTGIKVVPLWSQNAKVGYDNIGVIVPPQDLIAEILSPAEGSTNSNVAFTIEASGTVSPAAVTNIAFYDSATLLGNVSTYPYSFIYSNASIGNHTLTAVGRDSSGSSVTSAPVNIVVANLLPPPLTYPTNNAPAPIWPPASVSSLKNSSGTYTDKPGIDWYAQFGSATMGANYTITNTGRIVLGYKNLSYEGVQLDPSYKIGGETDVSDMTHMHVDVWTTANQFGIKLVSETLGTPGTKFEQEFQMDAASDVITSNHWVSLDIPFSAWTNLNPNLDFSKLIQILWTDNFGAGVQNGTFYIDNVYFFNGTPIIQSPAVSGANFTCQAASLTGLSYVLQGSPSLNPPTWTGLQTNAGTGGILNFSIPTVGHPQRYFRINTQ